MAPPIIGAIRAANFGGLIPTESCSLSSERSYSPSRFHLWLSDQQPIQTFVIGVVIVALEGTAKTAGKYINGAAGPEEQPGERCWRTHPDAFAEVWPGVEEMLFREPELQAKVIFEELLEKECGKFSHRQRRSFERRVRAWKRRHGAIVPLFVGRPVALQV